MVYSDNDLKVVPNGKTNNKRRELNICNEIFIIFIVHFKVLEKRESYNSPYLNFSADHFLAEHFPSDHFPESTFTEKHISPKTHDNTGKWSAGKCTQSVKLLFYDIF
jgi:hypothetical protein